MLPPPITVPPAMTLPNRTPILHKRKKAGMLRKMMLAQQKRRPAMSSPRRRYGGSIRTRYLG